jgi:hypothetical protein
VTVSLQWINTPVGLLVTMLAAFRLTRVIVSDPFPLGVLRARAVETLGARTPWERKPWESLTEAEKRRHRVFEGHHPLAYLITCYWCAGLYVSVACFLLACTGPWWMWAATPLAVSAVVGLLGTHD